MPRVYLYEQKMNSYQLVQASRREAPVKSIFIPRLELLTSNIGDRLENSVKTHVRLNDILIFLLDLFGKCHILD